MQTLSLSVIALLLFAGIAHSQSNTTLFQVCENTFENFPLTRSVACANSTWALTFLDELLSDDRAESVSNFLDIFSLANLGANGSQEKDRFLASVIPYLQQQTITNPPQYVSHGTDHSVRVMNWAITLQGITQLGSGMQTKYGMSVEQSKFVLGLMGLIHDTGYADLSLHDVPKWLHATSSSIFATQILAANNNLGRTLLEAAGTTTTTLYADFISSIKYHNSDNGFCRWTVNNPQFNDQCFFVPSGNVSDPRSATTPLITAYCDSIKPAPCNFTRPYVLVDVETVPLSFAIRVADNLDAIRTRLTPIQDDPKMMQYFLRIYQDEDLRIAVATNDRQNITAYRNAARERARIVAQLENTTAAQDLVMNRADEQSWLHFYSNWILDGTTIDTLTWTIQVNLYTEDGALNFNDHPGPGLYQINRLATSALTCHLSPTSTFLELVSFNFNLKIAGLESSEFLPLRAFTQQPVYNISGPVILSDNHVDQICAPFCHQLMPALTFSPEPCLNHSGQISAECDYSGFSQVPPFTDLTYPHDLFLLGSTLNAITRLDVGLTVGSAFLFVILVMIVVFTYLYQKKKQELLGYQHVSLNGDI